MKKSQEQYPFENQIPHNLHLIFISMMDINLQPGGGGNIFLTE